MDKLKQGWENGMIRDIMSYWAAPTKLKGTPLSITSTVDKELRIDKKRDKAKTRHGGR